MKRAVAFRATAHAQDFLPMSKRDILRFEGCAEAWRRALGQARHRARRPLLRRDARLLHHRRAHRIRGDGADARRARARRAIKEGWTQKDGKLPVNPSGGLKAKGHPIGATGVSMHALTAMQLCDDAGDMQVANAAARRHLQHGRRGGRELRERARADQVTSSPATRSSRTARSDNDGDHSPGALAWIASACRPRSKAPASAALTMRWRSTRLFPSKAARHHINAEMGLAALAPAGMAEMLVGLVLHHETGRIEALAQRRGYPVLQAHWRSSPFRLP